MGHLRKFTPFVTIGASRRHHTYSVVMSCVPLHTHILMTFDLMSIRHSGDIKWATIYEYAISMKAHEWRKINEKSN